jgi:hypothetical protein
LCHPPELETKAREEPDIPADWFQKQHFLVNCFDSILLEIQENFTLNLPKEMAQRIPDKILCCKVN